MVEQIAPRRFGPPPERQRYRLRAGAYALLLRDGEVLLTHQHHPSPEFQLPGGGIDPGEGQINALHRETLEETGWVIGGARRIGAYRRFCFMPEYDLWAEKLCHIWIARPILRLGPPSEAGHTAAWVELRRAARMVADPGAARFLALMQQS